MSRESTHRREQCHSPVTVGLICMSDISLKMSLTKGTVNAMPSIAHLPVCSWLGDVVVILNLHASGWGLHMISLAKPQHEQRSLSSIRKRQYSGNQKVERGILTGMLVNRRRRVLLLTRESLFHCVQTQGEDLKIPLRNCSGT